MLDKYPNIKKLFMRYNTMLPSSAPVERLFSMAALVLTGKRANLSDTLLEHLILLKIYRNLWNTYWIIFELFLNYFQFIFEFWINSNWINSFEKIELKIESESWINSMLIELCKHCCYLNLSFFFIKYPTIIEICVPDACVYRAEIFVCIQIKELGNRIYSQVTRKTCVSFFVYQHSFKHLRGWEN